jgi:hypothetical protein
MQENTYKEALYLNFNKIIVLLSERDIRLITDLEISSEPIVLFNGFITEEGFEYEMLNTYLVNLYKSINDFEFHELDKNKMSMLNSHFVNKLNTISLDPFENMVFEDKINQLSPEQLTTVSSFIDKQEELKENLLGQFSKGNLEINTTAFRKVKWQGTQQQFCELLAELVKKDWIEPLEKGLRKDIIQSICQFFDFSNSQDTPNADTAEKSIYRGMHSKMTNRFNEIFQEYDKIYTMDYQPKFSEIQSRN